MSSKTTQKALARQFMGITSVDEKQAMKLLKAANWKLEQACDRRGRPYPGSPAYNMHRGGHRAGGGGRRRSDESTSYFPPNTEHVSTEGQYVAMAIHHWCRITVNTMPPKFRPSPQYIPTKKPRISELDKHKRMLLGHFEEARQPSIKLLEKASAGRLPLPPALARALKALDEERASSRNSSTMPKQPYTLTRLSTKTLSARGRNTDVNSFYASNGSVGFAKETDSLGKLFEQYRVPTDDENLTSVDGTMQYLTDLGVNLENAEIFLVLEIVQAPSIGELSKDQFVDGWKAIGADTIQKQKAYINSQVKLLSTDMGLFKKVYKHAFVCARDKGQKALALENALVYWGLLFSEPGKPWITRSTDWAALWQEFLKAKWTKSVNRDMWNQTFEFVQKTLQDESLSFWSEDGAWPGVIDEFVAYVKEKRGDNANTMETD